jgi:ABC-type multidrug transport system permease subunit
LEAPSSIPVLKKKKKKERKKVVYNSWSSQCLHGSRHSHGGHTMWQGIFWAFYMLNITYYHISGTAQDSCVE